LEIADWLRGLSLERYAETFRDNAIDVAVLPELSESDRCLYSQAPYRKDSHFKEVCRAAWRKDLGRE
jgi:SAM domain (Sterile alpha motif)